MLKAALSTAAALLAGALLVAGPVQARTLDQIIKSGVIRVGVNPTLPPLGEYNNQNKVVGFDVDYSNEIAKKLGVKLKVVPVTSPDRIPFVSSGRVDMVLGGMTRNSTRAKVIDFTLPVYTEGFSVLQTTGAKPKTWSDLNTPETKLVEVRGTTPVDFIKSKLPKAHLTLLSNYPDVIRALAEGRGNTLIDVIQYVTRYTKQYPNVAWQVSSMPITVDYDCIGVAKGNSSLKNWLNVAIYELERSGVRAELWKKWFGIPMTYQIPISPYF